VPLSTTWRLWIGFVPKGHIESKELGGFELALILVCFFSQVVDLNNPDGFDWPFRRFFRGLRANGHSFLLYLILRRANLLVVH